MDFVLARVVKDDKLRESTAAFLFTLHVHYILLVDPNLHVTVCQVLEQTLFKLQN